MSPVLYNLLPSQPKGLGTKDSAVKSGRCKYPLLSPSPPMKSSPVSPIATGSNLELRTYTVVFDTGRPIGTVFLMDDEPGTGKQTLNVVPSVGPYPLMTRQALFAAKTCF